MEEYKEIKELLRPRRDFMASDSLRGRINATLDARTRRNTGLRWIWGIGASCAAAAVLIIFLLPSRLSANEILQQTLSTLRNAGNIVMTVEIRTRPMENFKYIDPAEGFVCHRINVARTDSALCWRIDKGGRTALGNSSGIYNWIDELKIGWAYHNTDPESTLGYLATFLTPETILESELRQCGDAPKGKYEVTRSDGEIILTVHSMPHGDFANPYMLNASITESENIRRYVIDAASRQLKSATVSILDGRNETEIIRVTSITYDKADSLSPALPSGIEFVDITTTPVHGLQALTPTEAASVILKAFEHWDTSVLDATIISNLLDHAYREYLQGAVLLSVGQSFHSGNEGTTFVPYTLRLTDGTLKSHNLALKKTGQGGWMVIGGL